MTAALVVLGEGGGELLGGEMAGEEVASDEIPGGTHDLGNGHRIEFNSDEFRKMLHSDEVVAAIQERAQGVCDECNSTKRKKNARYEVITQNEEWTTRARSFVRPANADAAYDDAMHSTMLKAAANAPNDPKIGTYAGGEAGGDEAAAGEAEEGAEAGEAAEVSELAEVAVVAL